MDTNIYGVYYNSYLRVSTVQFTLGNKIQKKVKIQYHNLIFNQPLKY